MRRATAADADAVADIYLASFRHALPTVQFAHTDDEVRQHAHDHWIATCETWVAESEQELVAMMVLSPGWLDQLYVSPGWQGRGIGRMLLDLAKDQIPTETLQLWTFQVNARARSFYERNGLEPAEATDGSGNEEREPDVRYVWRRS